MEVFKNFRSNLYQKSLNKHYLKTKDDVTNFDEKKLLTFSENIFCTLADDLLDLPPPSLRFKFNSAILRKNPSQNFQFILKFYFC